MQQTWDKRAIYIKQVHWSENLMERDHLKELGVDGSLFNIIAINVRFHTRVRI
jgi:hypothetical protein